MKKFFCLCLFLTVSSIYAENNPWLAEPAAVVDQQGTIFRPISYKYYSDFATKEPLATYKKVCPYGVIKIILGYLTASGEEVALEDYKILGCDTEQDYNDNLTNGTYKILRTNMEQVKRSRFMMQGMETIKDQFENLRKEFNTAL